MQTHWIKVFENLCVVKFPFDQVVPGSKNIPKYSQNNPVFMIIVLQNNHKKMGS